MSEFPFAEQPDSVEDDAAGNNKRLLVAGGLAALLVAGAGGYFLTSGGGEEETAPLVRKRPKVAAAAAPAAKPPATVPAVFAAPIGRDPFRALYLPPAAGPAAPAAPTTVTPTTAPVPGGGTPVVITPTSKPTTGTTTAPVTQSTIRLKAYDINTKVGTFILDGKTTLTAKVGDVLVKKVLIVAIRPDREPGTFFATLKVGDGAQFDAHFGQTVVIP
jgi:hypothetical protein